MMEVGDCTSLIGTRHRLDRVSFSWDSNRSGTRKREPKRSRGRDRVGAEEPLWAGVHENVTGRGRVERATVAGEGKLRRSKAREEQAKQLRVVPLKAFAQHERGRSVLENKKCGIERCNGNSEKRGRSWSGGGKRKVNLEHLI